ncbi:hypothetical protein Vi05172_g6892 [Venturia inaequalis]|nr:hypothetical protein Vi05172_g6892 [Venturia inaequalis]
MGAWYQMTLSHVHHAQVKAEKVTASKAVNPITFAEIATIPDHHFTPISRQTSIRHLQENRPGEENFNREITGELEDGDAVIPNAHKPIKPRKVQIQGPPSSYAEKAKGLKGAAPQSAALTSAQTFPLTIIRKIAKNPLTRI